MAPLSSTHVTPHFTRAELRYDDAPLEYRGNLEELAALLEAIRAAVGVPLRVTSGYRSPDYNATLPGASSSSQHLTGSAADFRPVGITVEEFLRRLAASGFALGRSQLLVYPMGTNHVHLGLPLAGKPVDTVLVQTAWSATAPRWVPASLADSATVYGEARARRGRTLSVVLLVVVLLGALVVLARSPTT
jgi:hypothetical protein